MKNQSSGKDRKKVEVVGYIRGPNGEVEFTNDTSEEAKRQVMNDIKAAEDHVETKRKLWGSIGPEAMTRLCHSFPTLRGVPGTDPWDALQLVRWLLGPGPTSGSRWAALFVLGVWNATEDWNAVAAEFGLWRCDTCDGAGWIDDDGRSVASDAEGAGRCRQCEGKGEYAPSLGTRSRFDVFAAMAVWDKEHIEAFRMWVAYPFFP